MKKIFAILCAASALLISCTKVAPEAQEIETGNAAGKLQVNIAVSREGDTKAVKTGWEKGDVIYVFFNNLTVSTPLKYLTLTFDGNGWDNTWYGDADADLLTMSTGTMSAIYFPFHSGKVSITGSGSSYQLKDSATNGKIDSYVLRTISSPYNITSGNLTGTLEMKLIPEDFGYILTGGGSHPYAFFMPDQNSGSSYVLECAYLNHVELYSYHNNYSYWQFDYKNATGAAGYFQNDGVNKGYVFTLYHDEADSRNASGYVFRLTNGTNKYDFFKSVSGSMLPGAYALPSLDSGRWMKVGNNETVTICGKKWATVNLDATDPKEVGTHGTWSSISGSIPSGWRLPTRTDFEELIAGTNQYYIPYYNNNGTRVGGYIFVDKTNPDNFIFFPGATDPDNDKGDYWASDFHHYDSGTSTSYYNYFHFTSSASPYAPTGGIVESSDLLVRLIKQ